jgi:hypothetical protein
MGDRGSPHKRLHDFDKAVLRKAAADVAFPKGIAEIHSSEAVPLCKDLELVADTAQAFTGVSTVPVLLIEHWPAFTLRQLILKRKQVHQHRCFMKQCRINQRYHS